MNHFHCYSFCSLERYPQAIHKLNIAFKHFTISDFRVVTDKVAVKNWQAFQNWILRKLTRSSVYIWIRIANLSAPFQEAVNHAYPMTSLTLSIPVIVNAPPSSQSTQLNILHFAIPMTFLQCVPFLLGWQINYNLFFRMSVFIVHRVP